MNQKKNTTLSGMLLQPLAVGVCALIFHNGQFIRTSTVQAIHETAASHIRFETRNTNYTLLLTPYPQAAASPLSVSMAA